MPLGQPVAKHRVLAEGALLRGVERRPFSEQLTRERELADVVELRRAYDDLFDAFRELEVVGDQRGETRRPPHMVVHLRGVALEPLEERLLEPEVPLSRLLGAGRGSNWLMGLGIQCESFPVYALRSAADQPGACRPVRVLPLKSALPRASYGGHPTVFAALVSGLGRSQVRCGAGSR